MRDYLFNTEKKRQVALAIFKAGIDTPIWNLMTKILRENIKFITKQILEGGEKKEMDRLRDRLKIHKEMINTPKSMIEKLTSLEEGGEPSLDPYTTEEQMKDQRKNDSS